MPKYLADCVLRLALSTVISGLTAEEMGCKASPAGSAIPTDGAAESLAKRGTTTEDTDASDAASVGGTAGTGAKGSGGVSGSGGSTSDAASGPDLALAPDLTIDAKMADDFWPESFTPSCTPASVNGRSEADGHHRAGEDCMGCHYKPTPATHYPETNCRGSGCHANGSPDGTGAPSFLFAGTLYRASTLAADPGVQVGVRDPRGFCLACSAANGNFWYVAPDKTASVTWPSAIARLRNDSGEVAMVAAPEAGCNGVACHADKAKLTSP